MFCSFYLGKIKGKENSEQAISEQVLYLQNIATIYSKYKNEFLLFKTFKFEIMNRKAICKQHKLNINA